MLEFKILKGKTLTKIEGMIEGSEAVTFTTIYNERFRLYHIQGCCEEVSLIDICGDVSDLINTPILYCEEVTNGEEIERYDAAYIEDELSQTWTFYKLATIKGDVTLRWLGQSNGYYSESVDFELLPDKKQAVGNAKH